MRHPPARTRATGGGRSVIEVVRVGGADRGGWTDATGVVTVATAEQQKRSPLANMCVPWHHTLPSATTAVWATTR
jgi:hypothetical protein